MSRPMKETNIPWIGQVPVPWGVVKLKKVAKIITGNTPSKSTDGYYSDSGIEWLKPENLMGTKGVNESKEKLNTEGADLARIAPPYTTLICCIGNVGKFGYITKPAAFNQQINGIIFSPDNIYWRFGMYYMSSQKQQQQFYQNGNVMKILNSENQKKVIVTVPPLEEQQKIAAFLDEKTAQIDSIIENTKQSIVELKKYKQALITETVTKGLNPNVKMKDSGIEWFGMIPEHWELSKLGKIYDVILGKMLSSEQKAVDWTFEQYICAANVHFEGVDTASLKSMWFSPNEKANLEVKFGDLLIVEGGAGAGGSAIYSSSEKNIFVQNSINIVRSRNEKGNTNYAYYLMHSLVKNGYIDFISSKSTFAHFTKEKVKAVPYPVIPIREQKEIITFLDEKCIHIDRLIADKEKLIREFEDYKKALIYEYVTGKKEVE